MRGLLRKDFYVVSASGRAFLIFFAVFALYAAFSTQYFFVLFPAVLLSSLVLTTVSYDERSRWQGFAGTLPVSLKTQVYAKYAFTLILLFGYVFLLIVLHMASDLLSGGEIRFMSALRSALVPLIAGLAAPVFMYPVVFGWGVEKGRIAYFVFVFAISALGGVFTSLQLSESAGTLAAQLTDNAVPETFMWPAAALGGALILFALSAVVSVKLYARREF